MKNKLFLLFWLFIFIGLSNCSCNQNKITVRQVILELSPILKQNGDAFSQQVQKDVQESNFFKIRPKEDSACVLKVSISPQNDKKDLLLMVSLHSSDTSDALEIYENISLESDNLEKQIFDDTFSKALEKLYLHFVTTENDANQMALIKEYQTKKEVTTPQLLNAISILGKHQDKAAEPIFIEMLSKTQDLSLGTALVKALGAMRSENGMNTIIEFAKLKPSGIRKAAIESARKISSKLSAHWLLVMAYGYKDPDVRKEAMIALKEVEKNLHITSQNEID